MNYDYNATLFSEKNYELRIFWRVGQRDNPLSLSEIALSLQSKV